MTHGDTVADSDRGEHDGHAACHGNAELDCLGDLVQVHMTGDDLVVGTDDADHGALSLLFSVAEGVKQASVRGSRDTFFDRITFHNNILSFEEGTHRQLRQGKRLING